ncbi:putative glycolipid-binding domain-containing protein, partial [Mesorhizobium sp. M1D.F.Ca.ET.234.01.1.1]
MKPTAIPAGGRARRASTVFVGAETLHFEIERLADGGWTLNGAGQAEVAGLIDVDLGFTPAT